MPKIKWPVSLTSSKNKPDEQAPVVPQWNRQPPFPPQNMIWAAAQQYQMAAASVAMAQQAAAMQYSYAMTSRMMQPQTKTALPQKRPRQETPAEPPTKELCQAKGQCERCGMLFKRPESIGFHPIKLPDGYLGGVWSSDFGRHCIVPKSMFQPGFPCVGVADKSIKPKQRTTAPRKKARVNNTVKQVNDANQEKKEESKDGASKKTGPEEYWDTSAIPNLDEEKCEFCDEVGLINGSLRCRYCKKWKNGKRKP